MLKGSLFTREYLIEGICQSEEWRNLNDSFIENFQNQLLEIFKTFPVSGNPLEATTEDDASFILDTFPIVKRHDESEFGTYRTKEMILAYMRALKAGDTKAKVAV